MTATAPRPAARPAPGDADLAASYRRCARIARRFGKTYATAARLLPASERRHVHAVYAFCRLADDIVDDLDDRPRTERVAALAAFGDRWRADLAAGRSDDPVLVAVLATVQETGISPSCFDRFLRSMEMDLTVSTHATYADLERYMDGSAAVIGEMMLPVLGGRGPQATHAARSLGVAFQLTNFLRDVGEDLERGRVYLPQEDLDRFGVDPFERRVTPAWRELMRFEIDRTRRIYREADAGIPLLSPRGARCVWTARVLYARILDRVEDADYDVFTHRATVPGHRKAAVAVGSLLRPPPGRRGAGRPGGA
ncbi:phytoene/squalene synthase family protein [Thalassiella azotivora]